MTFFSRCPTIAFPQIPLFLGLLTLSASAALAVEQDVRLVPQITAGTAGLEPGLALEWRGLDLAPVIIRPEIFVSEDGHPGGGGAILYDLTSVAGLPSRHALAVGPRAVYHHSDEYGWEVDGMVTWGYSLTNAIDKPNRHVIGVLGAIGVAHDLEHDESDVGVTGGVFYAFRL